jgi:hypothetical protein
MGNHITGQIGTQWLGSVDALIKKIPEAGAGLSREPG